MLHQLRHGKNCCIVLFGKKKKPYIIFGLKPREAAEIVFRLNDKVNRDKNFQHSELFARLFFLGSQLMGSFSSKDPESKRLEEMFINNLGAADWAFRWALSFVSTSNPAGMLEILKNMLKLQIVMFSERDLTELRLLELMISSGLWLASLSNMSAHYKTGCHALQLLIQKLQKLHFPTR
jgi:hypothetical protein